MKSSQITTPEVDVFKDAEIDTSVECHETLDIIKSVSDFEGKHETYVSWRKAAHTAYNIFEVYQRIPKHYQALAKWHTLLSATKGFAIGLSISSRGQVKSFHFANNYARSLEDRAQRNEQRYQK